MQTAIASMKTPKSGKISSLTNKELRYNNSMNNEKRLNETIHSDANGTRMYFIEYASGAAGVVVMECPSVTQIGLVPRVFSEDYYSADETDPDWIDHRDKIIKLARKNEMDFTNEVFVNVQQFQTYSELQESA